MKTVIRNFLSIFRRFKMATSLNVLGLAVAFAAFMVIMMQITYDLGFNKSVKDADNIYRLEAEFEGQRLALASWSITEEIAKASPHILDFTLANTMASTTEDFAFVVERNGAKQSYLEKMNYATPNFPAFFHFELTEGTMDALEDPGKVFLPVSMVKKIFGNESAIDKQLVTENGVLTVGGVYKDFPQNSSINNFLIIPMTRQNSNYNITLNYQGYIKVDKPESVRGLIDDIMPKLDTQQMKDFFKSDIKFNLTPLKDIHYDTGIMFDSTEKMGKQIIWVLIAIAFIIIIIAAINFTNYNMALTPLRVKSINTHKVMGASVGSLRGSLLIEVIGICFFSWMLSLGLVYLLSLTSVSSLLDADMALTRHIPLITATACISLLLGFFAGLYPSYYITSFAPALVLKGSFGLSPQGRSLRNLLMGMQFIASFALIVAALFMFLQNNYMRTKSVGYEKDQIIITNMSDRLNEIKDAFINELTSQAGISDVSFSHALVSGGDDYSTWFRELKDKHIVFQQIAVDVNFLKMMNIEIIDGRNFTQSDQNDMARQEYFIFNKRAKEVFEMAAGDKLKEDTWNNGLEDDLVVGFIPDVNVSSLRREIVPMAFSLIKENTWAKRNWAYIKVRSGSDMHAAMEHVKASLQKLSPDQSFKVRFFDDVINNLYTKEQNLTSLISWFSLIAVLISIVGVFGLVVFESEYKRKEIGVRKVLGSTTSEILAMFNTRYVKILTICFVVAAPIAWYSVHTWLQSFAYKTPMYWWVFALSFLVITMITTATVTFQSWQVANANPVDSIKTE